MTDRPISETCPHCLGEGEQFTDGDWRKCGPCEGSGDRKDDVDAE